jgi:hypothetical protein
LPDCGEADKVPPRTPHRRLMPDRPVPAVPVGRPRNKIKQQF